MRSYLEQSKSFDHVKSYPLCKKYKTYKGVDRLQDTRRDVHVLRRPGDILSLYFNLLLCVVCSYNSSCFSATLLISCRNLFYDFLEF